MAVEADHNIAQPATQQAAREKSASGKVSWLKNPVSRFFGTHLFSSITRRIIFLNLAALIILLSGILYLNQFRAGLTDARLESLLIQGQIIASAIAASATVETDAISIDPDKLLELQAGDSLLPGNDNLDSLDFPIDPEQVAPVLRQLISPTRTRARIYDRDGLIILDSRHLYSRGQILRYDLPAIAAEKQSFFDRVDDIINGWLLRTDLPTYKEVPGANGTVYPEVVSALTGAPSSTVRVDETGRLIVSVAVPIQRFRAVLGVLFLSTRGNDIDKIVRAERLGIVRVTAVAALVTVLLSIILAGTIAQPLRRLSAAAERVRIKGKTRQEIPDFSERQDEIGHLSVALREMTSSLYMRIEAIESFAADVSHELKNPLTSLRSAVETLPLVKSEAQKQRLLDVVQNDVQRLDRLITDISNASRLDAELAREDAQVVDLANLLSQIEGQLQSLNGEERGIEIKINIQTNSNIEENQPVSTFGKIRKTTTISPTMAKTENRYLVMGVESRIGQVINNLLDNACSFVPIPGGKITVFLKRENNWVLLIVEDNGPGIRDEDKSRIFERFYTDRPGSEEFGKNSGLGLSITRQIIETHGGTIAVDNIINGDEICGARFTIRLPAA